MKKIFLVDTENVNIRCLKGANFLKKDDLIILFTTNRTIIHNFQDKAIKSIDTKATIKNIHIKSGGKNCLDFQLVSYLGLLIGSNLKKNINYYIISKDKGYLSSINFLLEKTNCSISLISNLKSLFDKNFDEEITTMENMDEEITKSLKKFGYTNKTITKALIAIDSSKTEKDLEVNFFIQFGWNNKIYNICKPIISKYNILSIA